MEIIPMLLKEMEQEAQTTRKMLSLVPYEKFGWKPHEKSMSISQLATHIAELPAWVSLALTTSELDFGKEAYAPTVINSSEDLMACFEKSLTDGVSELKKVKEEDLLLTWTMRSGDQIFSVQTKAETIRHAFCQTVHHRAQLGIYLRLLNIPIPGSYGPSADEM